MPAVGSATGAPPSRRGGAPGPHTLLTSAPGAAVVPEAWARGCWALLSLRPVQQQLSPSPPPAKAPRFGSESVAAVPQPPLPVVRTPDPAARSGSRTRQREPPPVPLTCFSNPNSSYYQLQCSIRARSWLREGEKGVNYAE